MELILARHTGQDEEKVRRDIERDKFLTAEEAKDYGIIDDVLTMIKRGSERAVEVVSSLPGGFSSSLLSRAAV
jgi:ATP-dependent Clp protease, protease subunit